MSPAACRWALLRQAGESLDRSRGASSVALDLDLISSEGRTDKTSTARRRTAVHAERRLVAAQRRRRCELIPPRSVTSFATGGTARQRRWTRSKRVAAPAAFTGNAQCAAENGSCNLALTAKSRRPSRPQDPRLTAARPGQRNRYVRLSRVGRVHGRRAGRGVDRPRAEGRDGGRGASLGRHGRCRAAVEHAPAHTVEPQPGPHEHARVAGLRPDPLAVRPGARQRVHEAEVLWLLGRVRKCHAPQLDFRGCF